MGDCALCEFYFNNVVKRSQIIYEMIYFYISFISIMTSLYMFISFYLMMRNERFQYSPWPNYATICLLNQFLMKELFLFICKEGRETERECRKDLLSVDCSFKCPQSLETLSVPHREARTSCLPRCKLSENWNWKQNWDLNLGTRNAIQSGILIVVVNVEVVCRFAV